ncbi:YfhO family protein [Ligilactobacillus cholophilus]|uniref:YfhO family protein n=1 Tax=Ligilactobacillus cholophilus TaxID=3050131 RepID=UPI0025AF46C1|nr:YfhO family protein [Ligilactobacillus cholophilus]
MRKRTTTHSRKKKTDNNSQLMQLISFAMPVIIMLGYFIYRKMFPFGSSSILTVDMGQQYVDFYSYFRNTLLHHFSELFYSFQNTLGGGMWGTWAYYLFSPFNLILLFTPGRWLTFGIMLVTLLKVGFSGWTFSKLLLKEKWQKGYLVPALSIAYALNGFVVANMLNVMWLDAVVFLPLVILGIENLFDNQSKWVYPVFLAVILITNYYMGYMICIFVVLYFIWTFVRHSEKLSNKWQVIKSFVGRSLLAAGMAAVVLLPTFFEILDTKAQYNTKTFEWKFDYSPWKILSKFLVGGFNFDQMPKGTPNIFVGTLVLIGIVCYFTSKQIKTKEKIATFAVSAFFVLSLCYQPLDLFWHAMQFPVWYPYRFSYIVCFWLILIAARGLLNIEKLSRLQLILSIFVLGGILEYSFYNIKEFNFLKGSNLVISSVIILAFLMLLALPLKRWFKLSLLVLTIVEITANAALSLNPIDYVKQSDFANYVDNVNDALKGIRPGKNQFYRIGKTFERSKDDPMQCNYYGTDQFNSMLDPNTSEFMNKIGNSSGDNYTAYSNGTLFTDSFLGIKYMMQQTSNNSVLTPYSTRLDLINDKQVDGTNAINIYENSNVLPLGFAASSDILDVKLKSAMPIQNQNAIAAGLAGNKKLQLFGTYKNLSVIYSNMKDEGNNNYTKLDANQVATIQMPFTPKTNNPYYLTIGPAFSNNAASFSLNGQQLTQTSDFNSPMVLNVSPGNQKGEKQVLTITANNNSLQLDSFALYYLKMDSYNKLMKQLNKHQLKITHFSNAKVSGTITAEKDQVLMTTIPAQKGWHVKVDGKTVKAKTVLGEFLAVPLSAGKHTVTFTYRTPYIVLGALISIISIAILVFLIVSDKKRKTRR